MIINLNPQPGGSVSADGPPEADPNSLFNSFLGSAVSSIPETFGFDPQAGATQYRRDNPWLGVGSQVLGVAVPYTGWFKAAKGIGMVAKGAEAAEALMGGRKAAPILSAAARAVATDAPFEVGRTVLSTQTGDNTSKVATDAATNLALVGVLGGVGGGIAAAGRRVPTVPEISKEVNLNDAIPLQLRALKASKLAGTVTSPDGADYWINRYTDFVRREAPEQKSLVNGIISKTDVPFVGQLEGGSDSSRLERLFRQKPTGATIATKRLVPEDWGSDGAYNDALARSGLLGKEEFVQFPRLVQATAKGVDNTESAVTSTLTQVAPDTWMRKEANDGLYVMAKRIDQKAAVRGRKGVPGSPDLSQWMLFKTDSPGHFAPLGDAWAGSLESVAKWAPDPQAPIGTPINDAFQSMKQKFPLQNYNDTVAQGRIGSFLGDMKETLGLDKLNGSARQVAQHSYDFAKAHISPGMFQFSSSPRAAYIYNIARNVFHYADATAKDILNGEATVGGKSLFHHVLNGPTSTGMTNGLQAVNPMIDKLTEEELSHVWLARAQMWMPEKVQQAVISGEITPGAGDAIKMLNAIDAQHFGDVMKTQDAFGLNVSKPAMGHMMISNTWKGSIRIPVLDADGNLVILASGKNRAEALAQADNMIKGGKDHGFNWKAGNDFHADATTELQQLIAGGTANKVQLESRQFQVANALRVAEQRAKMRPATMREKQGVGGYVGQYAPWTRDELKEIIGTHVQGYQRYQARMNVENGLAGDMLKLMGENSKVYQQVLDRMDDLSGLPSKSSQLQNRIADASPLGAILGKDSASKAVGILNGITHHLQLGLGNISFPIINALQPLQTTLPQLAFVLRASAEDMQRAGYYSWNLASDAAGKPKTGAGFLNMAKMIGQAFQEMGKPSAELESHLSHAAREGQWSHTFNQEIIGQESAIGAKLRDTLEGKGGLPGMVSAFSNWLPNVSERFSRVQSFTLGHIVGRDFMNLKGDDLYKFAKRFTENSNFAYGTADRARAITGPMGSMFGLYKNWQMHYMGWMLNYIGQGVNHGNWAPLLYQTLGTAATGGIGSLAGFGAVDGLSKMLTQKDLMQHVYDNFGPAGSDTSALSDAVYFGLPAFLGASLQSQAAEPGANPVRDAAMLFSLVQYNRMQALGQAIGNGWDQFDATGENPMRSPLVRDNVLKALAPRSFARAMQTTDDGFIRSLGTGTPTAKASVGQRVLYAIGLNPVDVEKQMIVSDKLWRDQDAMKNAVQAYGKAMQAAEGNPDDMRAVMLRAMADGVPLDSIIRSSKARGVKASKDILDRQFAPLKVKGYEDVLGQR